MSLTSTINRNLFKAYAHVKYPPTMWKLLNRERVSLLKEHMPQLDDVQSRILSDLRETGIATTSLAELTGDENLLETLQRDATRRKTNKSTNHKKKFLIDYWDECAQLSADNPFLTLALSPKVLDIANVYMGMYTTLLYYTLQETIPTGGELSNSQNWHRDPQEYAVVKVFTYLNDIDETAGPFTYVPNSAPGYKPYGDLFPQQLPAGSYPGNGEVEKTVPEKDIKPMTGKAGTMIFCNTNGLHYGGVATKRTRLMSTFGYSAATYKETQSYHYSDEFEQHLRTLPKQSQHAIRTFWKNKKK